MLKEFSVYLNSIVSFLGSNVDNYLPKARSNTITTGGVHVSIHEYIGWVE